MTRLISKWLEADMADGYVSRIIGLRSTSEGLFAEVEMSDGSVWLYLDQNTAGTTGEIARELRPA